MKNYIQNNFNPSFLMNYYIKTRFSTYFSFHNTLYLFTSAVMTDIILDNVYKIHDRPPRSVIHYKQENFVGH